MARKAKELQVTVCADGNVRAQLNPATGVDFGHPPLQLSRTRQIINTFIEMLRQNKLTERNEFQTLGELLYQVLFQDERGNENSIGQAITNFLQGVDEGDDLLFLRIKLIFEEEQKELESWPWEYLFSPAIQTFLSMRSDVMITRYVGLRNVPRSRPLRIEESQIIILFVAACPQDLNTIHYESLLTELQGLERQGDLDRRIQVRLLTSDTNPLPTLREFVTELRRIPLPHIIHFLGHGRYTSQGGELAFVDENNRAAWCHESQFANWLGPVLSLKLVFLHACETVSYPSPPSLNPHSISGVAHRLAYLNIPVIVAMKYDINNLSANVFARHFYSALARAEDIDAAVQEGREQMLLNFNDERMYAFGLPTLYLRSPGGLFVKPPVSLSEKRKRKA